MKLRTKIAAVALSTAAAVSGTTLPSQTTQTAEAAPSSRWRSGIAHVNMGGAAGVMPYQVLFFVSIAHRSVVNRRGTWMRGLSVMAEYETDRLLTADLMFEGCGGSGFNRVTIDLKIWDATNRIWDLDGVLQCRDEGANYESWRLPRRKFRYTLPGSAVGATKPRYRAVICVEVVSWPDGCRIRRGVIPFNMNP